MLTARDHAIGICEAIEELLDARKSLSAAVIHDRRERLISVIESGLVGAAFVGAKTGRRLSE